MTEDEKIVLHSLKFIKRRTRYSAYVNLLTTLWKDWDEDKQEYFKELLWNKELIRLNTYQWEFQLTTKGKNFITEFDEELKCALCDYLQTKRDVRDFMTDNFIEPDPFSSDTNNSTDDGVLFLKNLKREKLIEFDDGILDKINRDWIPIGDRKKLRWFNTMDGPLLIRPTYQLVCFNPLKTDPLIALAYKQSHLHNIWNLIGVAWVNRNLKKLSMKNIIEMVIATIVGGFLLAILIW